ncbi:hypothetical protein BCIN_10g05340 [Botrytis cinerea B05.10]|uniref:Uncharacterized protein n=3 Tax=Botryotinia fuckeliana TaxID=40559 RepID=A0A384JVF2_BOTFB|nr:hypothetical protein BCIN_10g05340 [Botrytis cinerea B05.10]ATZ54540.1 hypothetical protein BCIN_10g05340 [Botrytis cinerea B05.10]EMR84964.1 hypothetical protein BcDW1_6413 [Botrytis cinerea BcDW1]CCD50927.1 hypothetical protein BofuT4_P087060.1 [Botrytis cinerea T4]
MSGIPRYNNAPLNARSGVPVPPTGPSTSSETAAPASSSEPLSNSNPTTTSSSSSSYPRAQPAAAVPIPTGLANSQRYAPPPAAAATTTKPEPTRTIKEDYDVPPAPQPGAFPKPITGFAGNTFASQTKSVPPPPRAGSSYAVDHNATSSMPPNPSAGQVATMENHTEYPPQMTIPPPSITRAPFSTTMIMDASTAAQTSGSYGTMHPQPVSVGDAYAHRVQQENEAYGQRRSVEYLEHPPGYVQNAYAAELSSDQRRAMDVNERRENASVGGVNSGGEEEGIWGSAKRWVGSAGSKLSEGEKEVWRRINGQ